MKSLDFDKNMILPDVPCGDFALDTLLETCFKDAAFDVSSDNKQLTRIRKSKNVNFYRKIKNRIVTRYPAGSTNTF